MKTLIYIAGPLNSSGDVANNIFQACDLAHSLIRDGFTPFVPHLNFFWNMQDPYDTQYWLDYDVSVLDHCQAIVRLPGRSKGADIEEKYALDHGITVFKLASRSRYDDLVKLLRKWEYNRDQPGIGG